MILYNSVTTNNLIFAFKRQESIHLIIIELIKLNEFIRFKEEVVLYSLKYNIHKYSNYWIIAYNFATEENISTYEDPIYDIAILVPQYTNIFFECLSEERLIAAPPDNKRQIIIKPQRKKKRKSTIGEGPSQSQPFAYTSYCEVE
ncbi:KM727_gp07-like protein [Aratus pisonii nudivirus]|nr:KM727_gp07-like protein [Aratus pisonii nudivirus]